MQLLNLTARRLLQLPIVASNLTCEGGRGEDADDLAGDGRQVLQTARENPVHRAIVHFVRLARRGAAGCKRTPLHEVTDTQQRCNMTLSRAEPAAGLALQFKYNFMVSSRC